MKKASLIVLVFLSLSFTTVYASDDSSNVINELDTSSSNYEIKYQSIDTLRKESTTKHGLKEDLSVDENSVRETNESGEYVVCIVGTKSNSEQTLYLDSDLNVYSSMPKSEAIEISVYNGRIVDSNDAIVTTVGGYDTVSYIYPTVDDAVAQNGGVPINGAAYDGQYITSENIDGQYYVEVNIGGQTGYMSIDDVQIIPSYLAKANSYYENVDGKWIYYSAIDPLMSKEYEEIVVDNAPEWAQQGTKYYTEDDENFTASLITNKNSDEDITTYSNTTYFQNLPFRSTSKYTANDFKNYLSYKGYTNSQYYNATSAFVEAQDKESVNALMLFAFANHESAYGTSTFSRSCNNFFGRGAYDSDPGNACVSYGFNTPRDGILSEAIFLNNQYFDVTWYVYSGTHFGNKSSGMNVMYASDPDWGSKNASHVYNVDSYLGRKENNLYRVVRIPNKAQLYSNSNLSTKINAEDYNGNIYPYQYDRHSGTVGVTAIVTGEGNNYYKVQVPTQVQKNASTCKFTYANKGSYPNYDKTHSLNVPANTGAFACDYGNFSNQEYYVSKSNTSVVSNNSIISPGDYLGGEKISFDYDDRCPNYVSSATINGEKKEYYESANGLIKCTYTLKTNSQKATGIKIYNSSNVMTRNEYYEYDNQDNLSYKRIKNYENSKDKSRVDNYYTDGVLKTETYQEYNSNRKLTYKRIRNYSGGSQHSRIDFYYKTNGQLETETYQEFQTNGKVTYKRVRHYLNNVQNSRTDYYFESNGKVRTETFQEYNSKQKVTYKRIRRYTNGHKSSRTDYYYDSNGQLETETYQEFDSNGKVTYKRIKHYKNGKLVSDDKHYY